MSRGFDSSPHTGQLARNAFRRRQTSLFDAPARAIHGALAESHVGCAVCPHFSGLLA